MLRKEIAKGDEKIEEVSRTLAEQEMAVEKKKKSESNLSPRRSGC